MDKKQLQEFISAIGSIAETALLFYRSTLAAKATPEEAMRLTQAFIAAIFYGNKNSSSTPSLAQLYLKRLSGRSSAL